MIIGRIEISIYKDSNSVAITKHYNDAVKTTININEDDIYALEFAVKEIKRKLELK